MTFDENRFRVKHGMTLEGIDCGSKPAMTFVGNRLRIKSAMTLKENVMLSPDFFGTKDLVVKQKRFFAPAALRMTAFVCHAEP
jgi:hypothetical protein